MEVERGHLIKVLNLPPKIGRMVPPHPGIPYIIDRVLWVRFVVII